MKNGALPPEILSSKVCLALQIILQINFFMLGSIAVEMVDGDLEDRILAVLRETNITQRNRFNITLFF